MNLVHKIESIFPNTWVQKYREIKRFLYYGKFHILHKIKVFGLRLSPQRPIRVVFFALSSSNWKYDKLYQLMEKDENFSPCILVCPIINKGSDYMLYQMHSTYSMLKQKGYNVQMAYNQNTDSYVDVLELKPDIIFFTNPYKEVVDSRYYIDKYRNVLSCYANYSFEIIPQEFAFNSQFHCTVWKYFVETRSTLNMVKAYSWIKGFNAIFVGYPMLDNFIINQSAESKYWKKSDRSVKRIIWAPHQSIYDIDKSNKSQVAVQFSTFLLYAYVMFDIARKYADQIQIVFKPHQLLRLNLYKHPDWGKEKTDEYYKMWEMGENTNYCSSDYVDLFNSSDALIHDCGSFTAEYICTQKPVMYLANYISNEEFNEVGKKLYEAHYKGYSILDIEDFIKNVVVEGKDSMKERRFDIFNEILVPPNGMTASENILYEIKKEIHIH